MKRFIHGTQTIYDRVAVEYAERFKDERAEKTFSRDCLDRLVLHELPNPACSRQVGVATFLERFQHLSKIPFSSTLCVPPTCG